MTSIVDQLKKTTDPLTATMAILDAGNPVIRLDLQNTQAEYISCIEDYKTILSSPSTGSAAQKALRETMAVDRCHAHTVKLLNKYDRVVDNSKTCIEKYLELFTKAKIAMELAYQTNQINTLTNEKVDKLVITDAMEYQELSRTISLLQASIKELVDIRAIHNAPVLSDDACAPLKGLIDLHVCRPVYRNKLMAIMSGDRDNRYQRIEDVRPIQSKMVAGKAGYNNVTCTAAFKSLCRIVEDLTMLHHHWYIDSPRYVDNAPNRVTQCLRSIKNDRFDGDKLDRFTAASVRCRRLDTALTLVSEVICPAALKEISALTILMEELGAHRHLTADAKLPSDMASTYHIENIRIEDRELCKFMQGSQKTAHADGLYKRVVYCASKFSKLWDKCNQLNSKFNRVNKSGVAAKTEGKNYSDTTMRAYMTGWNNTIELINTYLAELFDQTNPTSSWVNFEMDMPAYAAFNRKLKEVLEHQLDIEVHDHHENINELVRMASSLRVSTDQSNIDYSRYRYADQEVGSEFKHAFDLLDTNCTKLHQFLTNVVADKARTFMQEDNTGTETKLRSLYTVIGVLNGVCNWLEHDIDLLQEIYS